MVKNILKEQPEINIGLVGHVDHGKSTLAYALSGKVTDTHSEEIKRGITIRLGYADAVFYKCPKCKEPECYSASKTCGSCGKPARPARKISLIDAPGHETLMATMLSGAALMDGAILLIAANEPCPLPQTKEHLMALEIVGIKNIVIVQNKIDLVSKEEAMANYRQIKTFIKGTIVENAPIIPLSAQHNVNIDVLIGAIEDVIKTPERDVRKEPIMLVARSFDINRPGTDIKNLVGGVIGGALKQGILEVGQRIEIRPGIKVDNNYKPIETEIQSIVAGGINVKKVQPGGSVGICTLLDPSIVKADSLSGNVVGLPGRLPNVWHELRFEPHLLEHVIGAKERLTVEPLKIGEALMINVNSSATLGGVTALGKNEAKAKLRFPVCADVGDRLTLSKNINSRWRLIGWGVIK